MSTDQPSSETNRLPVVTIIIPCYNSERFIEKSIQSAVDQDYPFTNICVIDDGSSDSSWRKIHDKFFKSITHDKRVYQHPDVDDNVEIKAGVTDNNKQLFALRLKKNTGPSTARNIAIDYCWEMSDVYSLLDADDEYYPNKVSMCIRKWLEDPQRIGVVCTDYDTENTSTGVVVSEYKEPYSHERLREECIVFSGSLISKMALEATKEGNNYFDPDLHGPGSEEYRGSCEDYDMWVRISEKFLLIHVPEILSRYRVTGDNSSLLAHNQENKQIDAIRRIFIKVDKRREINAS